MARTSLDLELDLQASRTRQRQLNEEICVLRELRQRLEDAQLRGQTDLPHWVLRDERFRNLLKEAERQVWEQETSDQHVQKLLVSKFLDCDKMSKRAVFTKLQTIECFFNILEVSAIEMIGLLPNCVFI